MQRPVIDNLGDGFLGNGGIVLLKGVDHEPGVIVVTEWTCLAPAMENVI